MYYLCNKCDNVCSGNKKACTKCGCKNWLLVDDDGMVNIDLCFSPEELKSLKEATKVKYSLKRVTKKHMQRYIEETLTATAEEIKDTRDFSDRKK